jgi:hypothetical protein
MAITLKDGIGKGYEASVDSSNRLQTKAVSESAMHDNTVDDAQVYYISTLGFIDINTLNTETAILYTKNTSTTKRFIINSIRTCGNQVQKVIMYRNPTTGTIIDNATAGQNTNANFSSSNSAELTTYKGADTYTFTNGTHLGNHINNVGHSTEKTGDAIALGPNDTFGLTFELAASGVVCAALEGYFETIS